MNVHEIDSDITSESQKRKCASSKELIVCPHCHEYPEIDDESGTVTCFRCSTVFTKIGRVWDLRTFKEDDKSGWAVTNFENNYRKIGTFIDGYQHAARSGIPEILESYRLSRVKDAIGEQLSTEKSGRLLDIGCGNGWFDFRLREHWNYSGEIIGVDISSFQINLFLDQMDARQSPAIFACCANGESLPFASGYFDHVVISEVLEHVASPRKVIAEAARVLKPGGRIYISTPSGPVCRFWDIILWPAKVIKRLWIPSRTIPGNQIYDYPLSKKQLFKVFSDTGLSVFDYHKSVFLPHESYLQFFPESVLRIMLVIARLLEVLGRCTQFIGLHHMITLTRTVSTGHR